MPKTNYFNNVFYKSSTAMSELPNEAVQLIVTSPPYFNIKDYSKDGYQIDVHSERISGDIGNVAFFDDYINGLVKVWKECERVLKPNGKLCINVPLMPMLKKDLSTHYNRDIFDLQSHIQISILKNTNMHLMDLYIWNRTNWSKKLMFGSYPYPRNFYAQNSCEFIIVFVKDGKPENSIPLDVKEQSKLTQLEWVEYTKQIWNIPIPGRGDLAFGKHSAIMPEEIARRLIKLFTFKQELVLDPFAGSGTTLKVARELGRQYIGYEIYRHYKEVIELKLGILS
jgi:site-specific DNA-methyltransferase (cytosine-N4-specific)